MKLPLSILILLQSLTTTTSQADNNNNNNDILLKTSLQLEDKLKRCKSNEQNYLQQLQTCQQTNLQCIDIQQQLVQQKQITNRLQELLDKKDEDFAKKFYQIQAQHDMLINTLENHIQKLLNNTSSTKRLISENDFLKDQVHEERNKIQELETQNLQLTQTINKCEVLKMKAEGEGLEVKSLRDQIRLLKKDHDIVLELTETLESRDQEIEHLKSTLSRKQHYHHDPVFIKRLSNTDSLHGLLVFTNKTLQKSSQITNMIHHKNNGGGNDNNEGNNAGEGGNNNELASSISLIIIVLLVMGIIIIILPILISSKWPITNLTLWMTIYGQIIFLILFTVGFVLGKESLHVLRTFSHSIHDITLSVLFICFIVYFLISSCFMIRRTICGRIFSINNNNNTGSTFMIIMGWLGIIFCMLDFYFEYFSPSVLEDWMMAEMDIYSWLTYFILFTFQLWVVIKVKRLNSVNNNNNNNNTVSRKHIHQQQQPMVENKNTSTSDDDDELQNDEEIAEPKDD
jgi:uncharacterized membrane protein/uncharacterized protein (UPF0335 family)